MLVDALAELIQTCSGLALDLVEPDRQCVSAALRSRIAGRSSSRALWPVIASRSALTTSAVEERPAIAWLFVVGNVQFSGEP